MKTITELEVGSYYNERCCRQRVSSEEKKAFTKKITERFKSCKCTLVRFYYFWRVSRRFWAD